MRISDWSSDVCSSDLRTQRWRKRRCRWVPGTAEIDPATLSVDIIDTRREAAPFVREHHYAGSMPVARLSVGLFATGRGGRSELVSVCVFSHPVTNASVPTTEGLGAPRDACHTHKAIREGTEGVSAVRARG